MKVAECLIRNGVHVWDRWVCVCVCIWRTNACRSQCMCVFGKQTEFKNLRKIPRRLYCVTYLVRVYIYMRMCLMGKTHCSCAVDFVIVAQIIIIDKLYCQRAIAIAIDWLIGWWCCDCCAHLNELIEFCYWINWTFVRLLNKLINFAYSTRHGQLTKWAYQSALTEILMKFRKSCQSSMRATSIRKLVIASKIKPI